MRRDILSLFLLLVGVSVFAQPGVTGPNFDETKDAKLIFSQDFESDWETWTSTPVNTITQVEYYNREGKLNSTSFKPWENTDEWRRGLFRDTTITLYNGIRISDESERWRETPEKNAVIIYDAGAEKADRMNAMEAFGESDKGGDSYFKFVTDSGPYRYGSFSYTASTGLSARYARNLQIHGLDLEENSSYRLTFYVKAKPRQGYEQIKPTLYTDIMRGFPKADKSLSMGDIKDENNYKYNNTFEYTKEFYSGDEWTKVTCMSYYQTDSIAENYFYSNGYWWAEDSTWYWSKNDANNNSGKDLYYIVQPKTFYVRFGFASDNTEFCIDNISLTRSTIGGIEYYQHMLRVDFGYKTNLKKLAKAAYASTKIDAVELPGYCYEVWGQMEDDTWEFVDIASTEYQSDGFMYMFTNGYYRNGEFIHYTFDQYKKVLVTFINPTEEEFQLKYTGDLFPKANDIEWIKAGKVVENFYNEEAHVNPYVFAGVSSMYERAPVMQRAQYEDCSFGLDGSIREFKFKFSREMAIDNPDNAEQREKCIVFVNNEIWDRTWSASDSMLILTRPSKYTAPLSGDYVIEMNNIYIPNTQTKGDDVNIHYNFGSINRDQSDIELDTPIWDALFYDRAVNTGRSQLQPAGTAALYYSGYDSWGSSSTLHFEIGDGYTRRTAARLYYYTNPDTKYPAALSLSPRGRKEDYPASLYLGYGSGFEINLNSGPYAVKFDAASLNKNVTIKLFVYPFDQEPYSIDAIDKTQFGEYTFTRNYPESIRNDENSVLDTLMTEMLFGFEIEKPGRYIVEIQCISNSSSSYYPCALLSDIQLYSVPTAYNPIRALNDAVAAAQARVAQAADGKYSGDAKTTLNTLISRYRIDSSFTSSKPSDWYAAANETKNATKALGCRMDTVDMVVDKISEVAQKLAQVATDNADWTDLIDYKALQSTKTTADSYNYSVKSNADLVAFIGLMDEQMAVLDQRIKDNRLFDIEFTKAKALLSNTEQVASQELETLQSICNYYEGFDTINTTDQQLSVAIREVSGASYAYSYLVYIGKIGPRRVNELAALANALGSTITENESVSNRLSNLKNDDDDLADILKAAIKVAIYEKICNGDNVNNLDLSPFIKNYYLYATPIVAEEMDLRMPENRSYFRYSEDRHGNANMAHARHQYYSQRPIWMILTHYPFDNLLPGWTISAGDGNGNDIVFVDSLFTNEGELFKFSNLEEGRAVFDGAISMDWGSEAYLSSNVIGLPAGEYELGLDVRSCYDNSNKSSRGNGVLRVTTDAQVSETPLITGWLLEETILVPSEIEPGEFVEASNTANCDTTIFTSVNFTQSDNKSLMIDANVKAANGQAQIDNFKLTFNRDYNFNYSAALADARAQLNRLLADGPENIYNNVYQESISADAGSQVTIPIKMLNRNSITAFSFDVILPSGISFVRAQLANERANSHSISANVRYGSNQDTVSIACISLENKTFYGNDGAIVNLMVDVANDIEGDFSMLIDNIELVASATQVYNPQSFTGNITVLPVYTVGDVNEDSNISIMDAVGVVAFLTNSDVQGLDHHAADANCDGAINEDDANLIANYVIGNDEARAQLGEFSNGTANAPTEGTYRIYIDDLTTDEGSQLVIPIKMKNVSSVTAYSFDVTLPLGVTFQSAELVGSRTDGHTLFRNYKKYWNNNIVSFACISLQNNTYSSGDDAVINLTVNVAEDVEGIVDITIGNIEMAVSATLAYNPEDYTGSLTVNAVFDPADVNKDGKISIADAVGVVSFIINSDIQGLDRHAADANQDGTIDVTDVVWIINRVIGKSYAPSRRSTSTEISSTLALDYVLNTTSSSLSVKMEGLLNEITAVQFNVTLPSGLSLKKFSTSDTHMFASNRQEDGSYTVVCFSLTNSTFVGGGESVFEVEFDLDDSFQSAPVTLNNIKLVTPDCRTKTIDSLMISLSGSGPETGIIGVNDDSEFNLYDLQGRQIDKANGIFIRDNKKMMQAK